MKKRTDEMVMTRKEKQKDVRDNQDLMLRRDVQNPQNELNQPHPSGTRLEPPCWVK